MVVFRTKSQSLFAKNYNTFLNLWGQYRGETVEALDPAGVEWVLSRALDEIIADPATTEVPDVLKLRALASKPIIGGAVTIDGRTFRFA